METKTKEKKDKGKENKGKKLESKQEPNEEVPTLPPDGFHLTGEETVIVSRPGFGVLDFPSVPLVSGSTSTSVDAYIYSQPEASKPYRTSSSQLWDEIAKLKTERLELIARLKETENDAVKHRKAVEQLKEKTDEVIRKESLDYVRSNINSEAGEKLLESQDFRSLFEDTTSCNSFVLSIDIRRSTELMLKAAAPNLYEEFIVTLCDKLSTKIKDNFGIFDKFTGDGVLAFFPDFYSGEDAGLMAVTTALECHRIFEDQYKLHRHCFISILRDTGLGIGIDYGSTYKVKMNSALTVIGVPVVFACRMSGAKAGDTLLNQPAYQVIFQKYSQYFNFEETTIDVKNEGPTVAYKVTSNESEFEYAKPDWDELIKEHLKKSKK